MRNNSSEKNDLPFQRTCGFRLSILDALILSVGFPSFLTLYRLPQFMGLLPAFVILHFFLFCNVFRVSRKLELIWAALFLLNCLIIVFVLQKSFLISYLFQLPLSLILILFEIRQPYYHGVFSRKLNKRIDEYLAGEH